MEIVATKKNLQVGACVVDCGYQGEVHIHLTNVGFEPTNIESKLIILFFLEEFKHIWIKLLPMNPDPPVTRSFISVILEDYLLHNLVEYE